MSWGGRGGGVRKGEEDLGSKKKESFYKGHCRKIL